jgi:hypothetical protein
MENKFHDAGLSRRMPLGTAIAIALLTFVLGRQPWLDAPRYMIRRPPRVPLLHGASFGLTKSRPLGYLDKHRRRWSTSPLSEFNAILVKIQCKQYRKEQAPDCPGYQRQHYHQFSHHPECRCSASDFRRSVKSEGAGRRRR